MADLKLVVTADGEGYYVQKGEEESDSADWDVTVEFDGVRYLGETDGTNATLSIVTAMAEGSYDAEEEPDDDEEDEDEEEAEGVGA